MKKLLLALSMILLFSLMFTACGSNDTEESEPAPAPAVEEKTFMEASSDDLKELNRLFYEVPELVYADFNCNKATAADVINLMIPGYSADGYVFYFENLYAQTSPSDPKGLFKNGYYKAPEGDINWLVNNIFNVESTSLSSDKAYLEDGYYYIAAGGTKAVDCNTEIKDYTQKADGTYDITIKCIPENTTDSSKAVEIKVNAGVKLVNDIKQWVFFDIDGVDKKAVEEKKDSKDAAKDSKTDKKDTKADSKTTDKKDTKTDSKTTNKDSKTENKTDNKSQKQEPAKTTGADVAQQFIGSWYDKYSSRCGMDIDYNAATDTFNIMIRWGNSYAETAVWALSGKYNPDTKEIAYTGNHYNEITDEAGNVTKDSVYTNGSGKIYFRSDGYIYWQDNKDNAGEFCYFAKN